MTPYFDQLVNLASYTIDNMGDNPRDNKPQIKPILEYMEYKKYLEDALPTSGEQRGIRSELATVLRCRGGTRGSLKQ